LSIDIDVFIQPALINYMVLDGDEHTYNLVIEINGYQPVATALFMTSSTRPPRYEVRNARYQGNVKIPIFECYKAVLCSGY